MWGDFVSKKLIPPYYKFLVKQSPEEQSEGREQFLANLLEFTKAMDPEGPFFLGKELGYVDIIFAPWSYRIYILKHYRNFEIPWTDEYRRHHVWAEAVKNHPCVKPVQQEESRFWQMLSPVLKEMQNLSLQMQSVRERLSLKLEATPLYFLYSI